MTGSQPRRWSTAEVTAEVTVQAWRGVTLATRIGPHDIWQHFSTGKRPINIYYILLFLYIFYTYYPWFFWNTKTPNMLLCKPNPIFKAISFTVWILKHFQKVLFYTPFREIFPFSLGGEVTQTPSQISNFGPLGVTNKTQQLSGKKCFPRNQLKREKFW